MTITRSTQTWTIDAASQPWVYSNGQATTITQNETFQIALVDDDGTATATFEGAGVNGTQTVALADGGILKFSSDKKMVQLGQALADATAKTNAGSFWVSANGGPEEEIKVASITLTDVDATGANNVSTMTLEYPGKPYKWTIININQA